MKLEKIYEKLDGLSTVIHATNLELVKREIQELKNEIRVSILKSENKTSSKSRLNTMIRVAQKAGKNGFRVALSKAPILEDGTQLFTDSYFLVKLTEQDQNLAMDSDLTDINYPRTDRVISGAKDGMQIAFKISVRELLNTFKMQNTAYIKYSDDEIIALKKDITKNFITFMNYKPSDIIDFRASYHFEKDIETNYSSLRKPLHTTKENGTFGLILPVTLGTLSDDSKFIKPLVVEIL